ncbi:membralin-like protein At1g60995 isoform X2 [Cryptomeria japonica]|uniref:membralin-like protein At1g60995 isoform X2 n=1 Tax=Cryptomeria japonica TaxID=3369 RepID=UPI0027DA46B2|nr:membralin-like protein At1g60995 isoform X2 [Cryptomeria japonica]
MDPEQTFLRVHARLSGMLAQLLAPKVRICLEYVSLGVAIALLGLLLVMHVNFVAQPGCANELSGSNIIEAQLVQIKITSSGLWSQKISEQSQASQGEQGHSMEGFQVEEVDGEGLTFMATKFWLNWLGSGARRNKVIDKSSKNDKNSLDSPFENSPAGAIHSPSGKKTEIPDSAKVERSFLMYGRDSIRGAVYKILSKWYRNISAIYKRVKHLVSSVTRVRIAGGEKFLHPPRSSSLLAWKSLDSVIVGWIDRRSKASEPTYLYTVEKGYFMLPEGAKSRHNVKTVNVSISAQNSCFGNRWQQLLINTFTGYDTILMNSLLNGRGQGYLYNFQTKELYDLTFPQESIEAPFRFEDYLVSKCGVLIMSLFVFFTTTMSVSFTLRETQSRMLKFTVQLQHHARHHLPTFQLIFVHVIESLVFVPIMIGILFFLFEFYDDQLLAFMVLTLVWLCELFTMISVRTPISMQYFPRFFLLYFLLFHIYFFSYAYGFSYLAFSTTAAFMQHLVLYFWNRFEVPALQRFMRRRAQLQPQPGVQITSSAILTSTFHVARLNTRSAHPADIFRSYQQVRDGQPEENNGTGSSAISLGGTRLRGSLHRVLRDGDEFPLFHTVNDNEVRRSYTGRVETSDPNYMTIIPRGVNTDSMRTIISNSMHNNELRENNTSRGFNQQASGQDLQPAVQTATSIMNPNPLASFGSLLLWILGGPSDGLVSFFPMFRDSTDQGLDNTDSPQQENQQHVRSSWWSGSSGLERLRRRSGHSIE